MITSMTRRALESTQLFIDISSTEGQQSGLRQDSVVNCINLFTVEQTKILQTIGYLSPSHMQNSKPIGRPKPNFPIRAKWRRPLPQRLPISGFYIRLMDELFLNPSSYQSVPLCFNVFEMPFHGGGKNQRTRILCHHSHSPRNPLPS